jgi:hypothetical protein
MNLSGPDTAEILCRVPDGCCGPTACDVDEDGFICQIRALLPEGQIFNNTAMATSPLTQRPILHLGAITVGCNKVGPGNQLVFGGCCEDEIPCADEPALPQLALADAFGAVGFTAVEALCVMLRELDPCTAQLTIRMWARRLGVIAPGPCAQEFSDKVLALLICIIWRLRFEVANWDFLSRLAGLFGAQIVLRYAGQFDCPEQHPSGWWTMARDQAVCPDKLNCPDDPLPSHGELIPLVPACYSALMSLNIIVAPGERIFPPNCNLPTVPSPQPHDPEFYEAFKWLLPKILPRNAFWCVYERDDVNCIV